MMSILTLDIENIHENCVLVLLWTRFFMGTIPWRLTVKSLRSEIVLRTLQLQTFASEPSKKAVWFHHVSLNKCIVWKNPNAAVYSEGNLSESIQLVNFAWGLMTSLSYSSGSAILDAIWRGWGEFKLQCQQPTWFLLANYSNSFLSVSIHGNPHDSLTKVWSQKGLRETVSLIHYSLSREPKVVALGADALPQLPVVGTREPWLITQPVYVFFDLEQQYTKPPINL